MHRAEVLTLSLSSLRKHLRWLRHEARLERLRIAGLGHNGAGPELVAEHQTRHDQLERFAAAAEARIAELT